MSLYVKAAEVYKEAGVPICHLSRALGKPDNYLSRVRRGKILRTKSVPDESVILAVTKEAEALRASAAQLEKFIEVALEEAKA